MELLSCQLLEIPGSENTATVGANVGFILAGEYRLWSFPDQCDEVIAAIVASRDALSIYATLDRLPEAWKLPATAVPGHWYNLAVVHHLLGDAEAVARWLDTGMRYDCDRDDAVCQQFLRFKANLERLRGSLAT